MWTKFRIFLFVFCAYVVGGSPMLHAQAEAGENPKVRLLEFVAEGKIHTYKLDGDSPTIRFGTYPVEPEFLGSVGFSKDWHPIGSLEANGFHEHVSSGGLPQVVLGEAATRNISTRGASLRLQTASNFGVHVHLIKGLRVGYRFSTDSWRYERLGNLVLTTIPYIKASQHTHAVIANYTLALHGKGHRGWEANVEGGVGRASVRFRNGEEAYLSDHDDNTIALLNGVSAPLAIGLAYRVNALGQERFLLPSIRYEHTITHVEGANFQNRSLAVGFAAIF